MLDKLIDRHYKQHHEYEVRQKEIIFIANLANTDVDTVRARLTKRDMYEGRRPGDYRDKLGRPVVSKAQLAERIIKCMPIELTDSEAESVSKPNKRVLRTLLDMIEVRGRE